jgi:hypothetical protein
MDSFLEEIRNNLVGTIIFVFLIVMMVGAGLIQKFFCKTPEECHFVVVVMAVILAIILAIFGKPA